ncbi:Hypothetical predicted protein [Cloeon dipterum]|uniref:BTB domain-containing protein n=1 Tax=Cloeon dipterum TaxID=197152 RepID=A0A8S1D7R3_9INSE|nr:Hypothetical predicted protein [Cloeon dipterum]
MSANTKITFRSKKTMATVTTFIRNQDVRECTESTKSTFYSEKYCDVKPNFFMRVYVGDVNDAQLGAIFKIHKEALIDKTDFFGEDLTRTRFKVRFPTNEGVSMVRIIFGFCYTGTLHDMNIKQCLMVYQCAQFWRVFGICKIIEDLVGAEDSGNQEDSESEEDDERFLAHLRNEEMQSQEPFGNQFISYPMIC